MSGLSPQKEAIEPLMKKMFLTILAAGIFGAAAMNAPAAESSKASRPNIVVIMTDDQRWDSQGCSGDQVVKTPNIDLYHYARDPLELTNLATNANHQVRRESMKKKLFEQGFVGLGSPKTPR
jgi:hypothetical protein